MAGGPITTGSAPKLLWPGLQEVFGVGLKQHPRTYPRLFSTVNSDKNYEEYVGHTGFGPAEVKSQGQSISYDNAQQTSTTRLVNVTWAKGFMCTYEEMQDNLYPKVAKTRMMALSFSMLQAKE